MNINTEFSEADFERSVKVVVTEIGKMFLRFPQAFSITVPIGEVGINDRAMQLQINVCSVKESYLEPGMGLMVLPEGETMEVEMFKK